MLITRGKNDKGHGPPLLHSLERTSGRARKKRESREPELQCVKQYGGIVEVRNYFGELAAEINKFSPVALKCSPGTLVHQSCFYPDSF